MNPFFFRSRIIFLGVIGMILLTPAYIITRNNTYHKDCEVFSSSRVI